MNVLITHPDFEDLGGVARHYSKLKDKFRIPVTHFIIGKRADAKGGIFSQLFRLFGDYLRFVKVLRSGNYDVVHTNPSFDFKAFMRDGAFVLLGRLFKKQTVVFFHGWQRSFEQTIHRHGLWLFRLLFGKANILIVSGEEFKKVFESWGVKQKIYCDTMTVDDAILKDFDIQETLTKRQESKKWRILFLARLVREKGLYETIEAFSLLQKKYPMLELIIAGDGEELQNAEALVTKRAIANVTFTGYVVGQAKTEIFKSAHICCFPTYHGEGLATTICESMAFGLPVVTRPVGGVADFFIDKEHGFATNSTEPKVIAELIEKLLDDRELYRHISLSNYNFAQEKFLASSAAIRLENIYESALNN